MNTKLMAVLCMVAGFVGGVVSHYVFDPVTVRAQGTVQAPTEVRARKFVLVDENGDPRGVFGFGSDGAPTVQVRFGHPSGLAKVVEDGVGSARWDGVDRKKNIVPELQ